MQTFCQRGGKKKKRSWDLSVHPHCHLLQPEFPTLFQMPKRKQTEATTLSPAPSAFSSSASYCRMPAIKKLFSVAQLRCHRHMIHMLRNSLPRSVFGWALCCAEQFRRRSISVVSKIPGTVYRCCISNITNHKEFLVFISIFFSFSNYKAVPNHFFKLSCLF